MIEKISFFVYFLTCLTGLLLIVFLCLEINVNQRKHGMRNPFLLFVLATLLLLTVAYLMVLKKAQVLVPLPHGHTTGILPSARLTFPRRSLCLWRHFRSALQLIRSIGHADRPLFNRTSISPFHLSPKARYSTM